MVCGARLPIGGGRSVAILRDVSFDQRLRWWLRGDQELPLHASELVARQAAEIDEIAGFAGAERDVGAGALAGDAGDRAVALIGKDDVVLGAFTVDQGDLHDLTFGRGQYRIDLAIDRATDADEDHAPFGDPGAQRVSESGNVTGRRLFG